jgi:hypothetical protein
MNKWCWNLSGIFLIVINISASASTNTFSSGIRHTGNHTAEFYFKSEFFSSNWQDRNKDRSSSRPKSHKKTAGEKKMGFFDWKRHNNRNLSFPAISGLTVELKWQDLVLESGSGKARQIWAKTVLVDLCPCRDSYFPNQRQNSARTRTRCK